MEKGIPYIVTLDHIMSGNNDTPILEEVSDYLRINSSLTVKDLMPYLLSHNANYFNSDQENIATLIRRDIDVISNYPQNTFLGIRLKEVDGDFREIPEQARRIEREVGINSFVYGTYFLNENTPVFPLFEKYTLKCHEVMALNMLVTGVKTGGAPHKNENKVS